MYSVNEWYVMLEVFDKKTCNKLKSLANNWEEAMVDTQQGISEEERLTGVKGDFKADSQIRISDVYWTNDQWVYDTIWPYMKEANEISGWRYDITAAEPMQITRYQKGGFYKFHRDGMGDHLSVFKDPSNEWRYNKVRKLSMTVLLNDAYEGGEFQFASYSKLKGRVTKPEFEKTGSIIVFPSWMEHRVAPITKGIRYSLVCWFLGPPFV